MEDYDHGDGQSWICTIVRELNVRRINTTPKSFDPFKVSFYTDL